MSKANHKYYRFEVDSSGEDTFIDVPVSELAIDTEEELDVYMASDVVPELIRALLDAEEEPEEEDADDEGGEE